MAVLRATTDGVVTIRPPASGDAARLVNGRDEQFERFLGPGDPDPRPLGCIVVDDDVVGWVDHDSDRAWLGAGEVNVGYHLFAEVRGMGFATRAVALLLHHLAVDTDATVATFLIDPANVASQRLAQRVGARRVRDLDGNPYFELVVPPTTYTDGQVTIRRLSAADLDADLAAKDDEQIRWLWLPGEREQWTALSSAAQRAHALEGLRSRHDAFGTGPTWCFAVDAVCAAGGSYVAYVECDLANEHVPPGEANISYSSHPAHRGHGHASRAVRLVLRFIADHTAAREAHIVVDADNEASLRVARATGAVETQRWTNGLGRPMIRHVVAVPRRR